MNARTLLVAAVAVSPTVAAARENHRMGIPVGHRPIGLAGAYSAVGGDGNALWYNPAGLGGLPRQGVSANLAVYHWRTQRIEGFVDYGIDQGTADAESSDFATIPSSLVYALPLGDAETAQHGLAAGLFVPDDDTYDIRASSQVVGTNGAVQVKASDVLTERSYWLGAGWGWKPGPVAVGLGAFGVVHTLKRQVIASIFADGVQDLEGLSQAFNLSATDVTAVVQAGALWQATPTLRLGLNVRGPSVAPLHQSGEVLVLFAGDTTPPFLDRHESSAVETEQRQPLRATVGAAWQATPEVLVTFDGTYVAAQPRYTAIDAPTLAPTDAAGRLIRNPRPAARVLEVDIKRSGDAVVNAALGAETKLGESFTLRGGVYTDFASVDAPSTADTMDYDLDLFGLALGLGFRGERGTTDVGVLVRQGKGSAYSDYRSAADRRPVSSTTDAEVFELAFFLGGSADL